jgi:drug/metabolite transporter (DMT)-like permease
MKELKPTTVAVLFIQPVFATVFAIGLGKDELNLVKILSAILILVSICNILSQSIKREK